MEDQGAILLITDLDFHEVAESVASALQVTPVSYGSQYDFSLDQALVVMYDDPVTYEGSHFEGARWELDVYGEAPAVTEHVFNKIALAGITTLLIDNDAEILADSRPRWHAHAVNSDH